MAWQLVTCSLTLNGKDVERDLPAAKLYSVIKKNVQEAWRSKELSFYGFPREEEGSDIRNLAFCFDAGSALGIPWRSQAYFAITVALAVEMYEAEFDDWKIPPAISANSISAMEQLAVQTLKDRRPTSYREFEKLSEKRERQLKTLQRRLLKDLTAYTRNRAKMPQFVFDDGCGDGEVDVKITTNPPGATVSYIPVFSYKLCQATKVNPDDAEQCDGWVTAVNVNENLVGRYRYVAKWSDGTQRKGILNIAGKSTVRISQ
jgi:hypothetical protein